MSTTKVSKQELLKQLELYAIISKIGASFANVAYEKADEEIDKSLKMIGRFVNADRSYIFIYDWAKQTTSNTHEYCSSGIMPVIDTLQDIPLAEIPDWVNTHLAGEQLYIEDVFKLPTTSVVRQILEPQGVKSLITIPLFDGETLYGFLGFDSVKTTRSYSKIERSTLVEYATVLMGMLKRISLEQQIDLQNMRFAQIAKTSGIGMWEYDVPSGKINVNSDWARMVGYSLEDLQPLSIETWRRLTHPDDLIAAEEKLNQTFRREIPYYEANIRMKHRDGHYVWIRDSGKVITWDKDKPLMMLGTHVDISKIKESEDKLNIFKSAVEFSPSSMMVTDKDGTITYANPNLLQMTGYELHEIIGKKPSIFKSNYHDSEYYRELWATLRSGHDWHTEFYNIKKNGQGYWEYASISPVFDNHRQVIGYVAIKKDITKIKEMEKIDKESRTRLETDLKLKGRDLEESQKAAVFALAHLTETRDYETGQHIERVQYLCKALASKIRTDSKYAEHIDEMFIDEIFYASVLHDIGKIKISDEILLKPGRFTPEEFQTMQLHVKYGADTLYDMVKLFPTNKIIIMGAKIARYHHEWWDGSGYLEGLKGEQIPLPARIMSVVDTYDALRSKRPYKEPFSHSESIEIIKKESGTHFDPVIIDSLLNIQDQIEIIYDSLNSK